VGEGQRPRPAEWEQVAGRGVEKKGFVQRRQQQRGERPQGKTLKVTFRILSIVAAGSFSLSSVHKLLVAVALVRLSFGSPRLDNLAPRLWLLLQGQAIAIDRVVFSPSSSPCSSSSSFGFGFFFFGRFALILFSTSTSTSTPASAPISSDLSFFVHYCT
jgi:hypothetical protein